MQLQLVHRFSSYQEYARRIKSPQQKYDESRKRSINGAKFHDLDDIEGKDMLGRFEEDSGYKRSGHGVPPSYFFLGQNDVEGRDSDEDEYERHYILDDEGSDCPYLQAGKIASQCIENRYSGRRTEG
jgi:hypothetical protein